MKIIIKTGTNGNSQIETEKGKILATYKGIPSKSTVKMICENEYGGLGDEYVFIKIPKRIKY